MLKMDSFNKVVVEPEPMEPASPGPGRPKKDPISRIHKILRLILKLAQVDAYDINFQIKSENGVPVPKSDVGRLTLQALSPGRVILGEEEFVRMLHKAGIYPDEIVNDQYKAKLSDLYNKYKRESYKEKEPIITEVKENNMPQLEPAESQTFVTYRQPEKRSLPVEPEDNEENIPPKKVKSRESNSESYTYKPNWDVLSDEDE